MSNPLDYLKKRNTTSPGKKNPLDYITKDNSKTPANYASAYAEKQPSIEREPNEALANKPKPNQSVKPIAPVKSYRSITDELMSDIKRTEPVAFSRWDAVKSVGSGIAKELFTSESVKNMGKEIKGGYEALIGDELTLKEKAGAMGMAPVDVMVGLGNSLIDFGKITIPKTIAVGALMFGDAITDDGEERQPLPEDATERQILQRKMEEFTDDSDTPLGKWRSAQGEKVQDYANDALKGFDLMTKERREELGIADAGFFSPKNFGYAVGSGASSLAVAAGVSYVTKSPMAAGLILGSVEASDTYVEAKTQLAEKNPDLSTDEVEKLAAQITIIEAGGIAYLEKLGIEALFHNFVGGSLRNASVGAITETFQETSQTVYSNAVEKYGYNETKKLTDDIIETIILTLPIGFVAGGVLGDSDPNQVTVPPAEREKQVAEVMEKNPGVEEADVIATFEGAEKAVKTVAEALPEQMQKATEEQKEIKADIAEEVEAKGKEAVAEALVAEEDLGVETTEEANQLIEEALEEFNEQKTEENQDNNDIMSDLDIAIARVKGQPTPSAVQESRLEDLSPELEAETQEAFDDQYGEAYNELSTQIDSLNEKVVTAESSEKADLQSKIGKLESKQDDIKQEFKESIRPKVEARKEAEVKAIVDEVKTTVATPKQKRAGDIQGSSDKRSLADRAHDEVMQDKGFDPFNKGNIQKYVMNSPTSEEVTKKEEELKKRETEGDKSIDKTQEKEDDKDNGKSNDTKRDVQPGTDTTRSAKDSARQDIRRADDTKSSEQVARGGRGERSTSPGERPSYDVTKIPPHVKAIIRKINNAKPDTNIDDATASLTEEAEAYGFSWRFDGDVFNEKVKLFDTPMGASETRMEEIYLRSGLTEEDSLLKVAEVADKIKAELDLVEGQFPTWFPNNVKDNQDLDYLNETFEIVKGLNVPTGKRRRALANGIFDELDKELGVDTALLREDINNYYDSTNTEPKETETTVADDTTGEQEVEERGNRVPTKEREQVTESLVETTEENKVETTDESTASDEKAVNDFVPSGGRANEGVTGRGLLDQYFTPQEAVTMTYDILRSLGVKLDNALVLEPSAGTGHFLNDVPNTAKVTAYEIDGEAAKALKVNHPGTEVINEPFERNFIDGRGNKQKFSEKYDLVVGNPPYGKHRGEALGLGEETKIAKYETYFIKRSLDLTKEGGYVALVVPSSFARSSEKEAGKEAIMQMGELVGAVRLPNGAFKKTGIGTDILVFKKSTVKDLKGQAGMTIQANRMRTMSNDTYFNANTDNVLGYSTTKKGRFGIENVVEGSLAGAQELFDATEFAGEAKSSPIISETYVDLDTQQEIKEKTKDPVVAESTTTDIQNAKPEALHEKIATEKDSEEAVDERNRRIQEKGQEAKKELVERTVKKVKATKVPKGMMSLSKFTDQNAYEEGQWEFVTPTGELAGDFYAKNAYYNNGKYYNEFNYVQGNIYNKLAQLETDKATLTDEQYNKQKTMLEAVLPEVMPVDRMRIAPHARFVELTKLGEKTLKDRFTKWIETLPRTAFGESSVFDIKRYMNGQSVRGNDKLQNERDRANRRIVGDELFSKFLTDELTDSEQEKVEYAYNAQFNGYHRPDYGKVPLKANVSASFKGRELNLRDVQQQGVGFLINRGVGLLAHEVGIGKTIQGIIANIELLERGWAKRPLIVLPNINVYKQWIAEIQEVKPGIVINELANLGGDFTGNLETLTISEGSLSVITDQGFKKLGFKDETYTNATTDFNDVIEQPGVKKTARQKALEQEKAGESVGKMKKGTKTEQFFEDLGFDALTIDEIHNANHIIAKAKQEDGKTSEFRGFQVIPSQYGLKVWLAAQYIQENNNGRNVIGLSATPFTNNPLEYYSILSLFARSTMEDMGILNVNDFMAMFMDVTDQLEFKADGSYSVKSEVRNFKNYQQFQQLLTQFIDFRDGKDSGIIRPERQTREYKIPENQTQFDYKQKVQPLFNDKKGGGTLKAIGEMRHSALSPFLSMFNTGGIPNAKEFIDGSPKLKLTMELVIKTHKDIKDSAQIIYSPIGVELFPLMQQYLVEEGGFKPSEVEIITGKLPKKKANRSKIQADFNSGKVKVILGSDAIQEGVNLQEKTTDLYILSQPWNFTAVRQVIGRAWRHGNQWRNVRINQMFTENSIDIFMSQKLENKERRYQESIKAGSDVVEVSDIDYEEMKHSLLTDPVERTKLEYQMKTQDLELSSKRLESDFAYQNRKNEQYMKAYDDVVTAKQKKREHPDWDWLNGTIENAETRLKSMHSDLVERGVDVVNLEKSLKETNDKIASIEAKKENLVTEQELAMNAAEAERTMALDTVGKLDVKKFVSEREQDNQDLFISNNPMFSRTKTVAIRDAETGKFLGSLKEETKDEFELRSELEASLFNRAKEPLVYPDGTVRETQKDDKSRADTAYQYTMRAANPNEVTEKMNDYKARFNTDFSVEFADFLFTGEDKITRGMIDKATAYGVYSEKGIAFRSITTKTTPDHEMIHLVLDTLVGKIDIFKDFTKEALLMEANNGQPLPTTGKELTNLEEKIAKEFESFIARRELKAETLLGKFYQVLHDALLNIYKAFGYQTNMMKDFYQQVATGKTKRKKTIKLNGNPARKAKVRFQTPDGFKYLDFGALQQAKFNADTTDRGNFFNEITKDAENHPQVTNSIKKDINLFENIIAQSRDIFLKDPKQFKAADEFEIIAEKQDADKNQLDNVMSDNVSPYMKLPKSERDRVDEILWRGDALGKEFDKAQLLYMSLNDQQIEAYEGVRYALDTAHELLLMEMGKKGVEESEIDAFRREREGYMPHKWEHPYVVKHRVQNEQGKYETYQMESFKSERLATERADQLAKESTDSTTEFNVDKLSSLEVDFFSSMELTSERMVAVINQMQEKGFVRDDVTRLIKNNLVDMFKEKGFGRHYLRRTGVGGFDTQRTPEVLANYFAGFSGYISKMRWSGDYFNTLSEIDARRQPQFFSWLRDTVAYKLNNKAEDIRISFKLAKLPVQLSVRSMTFAYFLANDLSYLLTNATQNITIGLGEMSKYLEGKGKIIGPETRLIKALADYNTGRTTPVEAMVIDELIARGDLGAEMAAELSGFKNNPLYSEISSRFQKVMYKSTSIVEQNINRVPMFLAMYRVFTEQGMTRQKATAKALEVSNDIHFRYGRQHRPKAFRGKLAVLFVFQHYIRSLLFQLYRDLSHGEFIVLIRKMGYTTALGGVTALPFAQMMITIFREITGDDEEEDEIMVELERWEILLQRGIPAAYLGVDLSSRVGIGLMSVDSIWDNPSDVRSYIGATGSLLFKRLPQGIEMIGQQRYTDALAKLLPDVFANPIKAFNGYTYGVRTSAGNPLLDYDNQVYKYNTMEALIKAAGYTPTHEAILWEQKVRAWDASDRRSEVRTDIRRTIQGMVARGDITEARELQQDGINDGTLGETTNYVKEFTKDAFMNDAVTSWEESKKRPSDLERIEDEMIDNIFNGVVTDLQRNNIRKELAIYRHYGLNDEYIDDIMGIRSNADKVQYLTDLRDVIGKDEFAEFYEKGRRKIRTEAGNRVPVLFSDNLDKELRKVQAQ